MQWVRRLGKEGMSWFGFEGGGAYGGLVLKQPDSFQQLIGPTVYFKVDIFSPQKARKEVRGREGGQRWKNPSSSKFERELKKLECFVNYEGAEEGKQLGSRKIKWEAAAVGR